MKSIKRKTLLYKSGVEYGDYTMNHVLGCSHGCLYPCYAFMAKKRFRQIRDYQEWIQPAIVENTLELLDFELPKYKNKIKSVQLCFTTDPFMVGYPEIEELSLKAIEKINSFDIPCTVLTKGILPDQLAKLSKSNSYGITLVSLDEEYRKKMEPGAAPYIARINALKRLHNAGCKTWVSIEPYPTPNIIEQDLNEILKRVSFVDQIILGRTNYSKDVSSYPNHKTFYNMMSETVTEFCKENGIGFLIKKGTKTDK